MNKTKKRAAKRSAIRRAYKVTTAFENGSQLRRFRWPFPMIPVNKIRNLKAYKDHFQCSLLDAKNAVERRLQHRSS